VIAYSATLLVELLAAERLRRGTGVGARTASCRQQAVLVLRWFREDTGMPTLARDARVSQATGYRYLHEGIDVLAAQAPDLHEVLAAGKAAGWTQVTVDGTLVRTDRVRVPGPTGGWTCGGRANTPPTAATSRSSPPPTAGRSGPPQYGPVASTTPPPCAATPRRYRCWPNGPMRTTRRWPTSGTKASERH
jgi:hypothetical protein